MKCLRQNVRGYISETGDFRGLTLSASTSEPKKTHKTNFQQNRKWSDVGVVGEEVVGADESTGLDGLWDGPAGVGVCISAIGPGTTALSAAWPRRIGGRWEHDV